MDRNTLIDELKKIAVNHWDTNGKPILLSDLAPLLSESKVNSDYKSLLKSKSLKTFIKETEKEGEYRLLQHPTQAAKVALLPGGETFEFKNDEVTKLGKTEQMQSIGISKVVELLNILSCLSSQDLEKVSIPASVFVKLHKVK